MSKAKAQGTTHESWIVNQLTPLGFSSRRIAEGGSSDEGDVEVFINDNRWILEGKATQNLNVQKILGKARKKARGLPVAVVWKRLVKVAGMTNRQPVEGERVVVVLSWEDFLSLLENNLNAPTVDNSTIKENKGELND
jgi:hypothetical protein